MPGLSQGRDLQSLRSQEEESGGRGPVGGEFRERLLWVQSHPLVSLAPHPAAATGPFLLVVLHRFLVKAEVPLWFRPDPPPVGVVP